LRVEPEDFFVEEVPAYEPTGSGEHLFLWLEKRNLSADRLIRHVARCLDLPSREVGCAGLKDTRAVTRQYLSVPASCEPKLTGIDSDRVQLLAARHHGNKLRTGHLRGNRFEIRIREPEAGALERARAILAILHQKGVPNYFGPQRFGRDGETGAIGMALLRGERHPAFARVDRGRRGFLRRLGLSAAQSLLFNECLARRLRDGLLHQLLAGDVCQVCASHGPFLVEDVAREQARFDAREIVPAGPLFGPRMRAAQGEVAQREEEVVREAGLDTTQFAGHGKLLRGARRAYLTWPELEVAPEGEDLRVRFTLDRGSYATVVLDEITKAADGESESGSRCDP
jgi:tRNA pseudouridine13 synthase